MSSANPILELALVEPMTFLSRKLSLSGDAGYIWKLGYDPIHWDQDPDPKVLSTVLREGNYDYVTNQVHWDMAAQTIPDSPSSTPSPPRPATT